MKIGKGTASQPEVQMLPRGGTSGPARGGCGADIIETRIQCLSGEATAAISDRWL
jgi:hypothetical protein